MSRIAQRVQPFGTTIFTEMTNLANQFQAVNLGQGFPDFPTPTWLKEAAQAAITQDINQYAPAMGRMRLRQAIADKVARHYGLMVDPVSQILVTHGATEAIFATILGLVDVGDEVILFEPTYDSYVPATRLAGGIPIYYPLRPPHWQIDFAALAQLFTTKTKLLILNTPHNPTGKCFSGHELEQIGQLCRQHNVLILADEVYEHILFDGLTHTPIATLPELFQRTVTISSLGKTFSCTGWKVGWIIAPPELIEGCFRTHQFMTFCGAAPLQEAAAIALERADALDYYAELTEMYQQKRDFLVAVLQEIGLRPIVPQGTYFVMGQIDGLGFADDLTFCRHLTQSIGVAAIPPSAFYHNPSDGATLARFAFCKSPQTLQEAAQRLKKLQHQLNL